MIHVVAIITAKPGQRDAILQAFRANIPACAPRTVVSSTALLSTPRDWALSRPRSVRIRSW